MFFLIRCVFWLWVVFSTIFAQPSADGTAPHRPDHPRPVAAAEPVGQIAQAWLGAAASRVADHCAASPAACLAIATQLSKLALRQELADTTQTGATAEAPHLKPVPRFAAVPLPPRRPETFGRTARPALEKTAGHEYLMDESRAEAEF
ncbi:hypothetical protein [uncultured Methylovirgula sp.]|uniref:hypothetical protein n=1 Tax=uncultured Methylovirgula sp. TaxID=1285960 RepID=UPI0026298D07|nr:hypothetical protein [uncultured Methylovirgula sp.]